MHFSHICSIVVIGAVVCCAGSQAAVLYDGSTGQTPGQQGWLFQSGVSASQSNSSTFTTFDSTNPIADQAGYTNIFHPSMPELNRADGFILRFNIRVVSESHIDPHRAGFSVIAISEDLKGVELSFWGDEVWTQQDTPLFERNPAESVSFDTTAAIVQYELSVLGDNYTLSAPGMPDLTGMLKDYTAFDHVAAGLPIDPYEIPSHLFFGDDTTSAEAAVELSFIEAIPEPATLWVLVLGGAGFLRRRRRHR